MLVVFRYLLRKNYNGIALWPFIILRKKELKKDRVLINHERIHLRQQLELLVLPFFVWYGLEYLVRLIQYKDTRKAYRNISFEREAYSCEKDLHYLKKRSFWKSLQFI